MKPERFNRRAFVRNTVVNNIAALRKALAQPVPTQQNATSPASPARAADGQSGVSESARQLS